MNMSVNGFGDMNTGSAIAGTLSIKDSGYSVKHISSSTRTAKKTIKKLNYNHKEVSGQILKAKKAQSAAVVLNRAKSKLANVQRAAGTGQYDEKEVATAIAHARRIVRCAQLKVRNLKEEEAEQQGHKKESSEKAQQKQNEIKRQIAQKERELLSKAAMEQMQLVQQEKSRRQGMLQKRRMHRNEELGKIKEADMKYLKEHKQSLGGENQDRRCIMEGVSLDLSQPKEPLTEAQIEQQAEQEIEAVNGETSVAMNTIDVNMTPAINAASSGGMAMDGVLAAGGVDILI